MGGFMGKFSNNNSRPSQSSMSTRSKRSSTTKRCIAAKCPPIWQLHKRSSRNKCIKNCKIDEEKAKEIEEEKAKEDEVTAILKDIERLKNEFILIKKNDYEETEKKYDEIIKKYIDLSKVFLKYKTYNQYVINKIDALDFEKNAALYNIQSENAHSLNQTAQPPLRLNLPPPSGRGPIHPSAPRQTRQRSQLNPPLPNQHPKSNRSSKSSTKSTTIR